MSADIETLKVMLERPVVLVGMMGSGKSHIGRIFAEAAGLEFRDSDVLIEQRAGMSIAEIFKTQGESHFREMERAAIEHLIAQGPGVISTGGGAVTNPETLRLIKDRAVSVWLNADSAELVRRIGDVSTRPLLASGDPRTKLDELMGKRRALYEQADIHIDSTGLEPGQTLERLINSLCEHLKPGNI